MPEEPGSTRTTSIENLSEWNPPGEDSLFNELFPPEGSEPVETAPQPPPQQNPPQVPQSQPEPTRPEFVLETRTGTRYRTADEAARGIEEKDRLIENLRRAVSSLSGVDPLNNRPVSQTPQSYAANPQRYIEDMAEAAARKDWNRYAQIQAQFISEIQAANISPYMPVIQEVGKLRALEQVSAEIAEFRRFYGSAEYAKVLEQNPELQEAIVVCETDPQYAPRLAGLYRTVWRIYLGTVPQQTIQQQPSQPAPSPQPRPTMTATQLPPPQPQGQSLGRSVSELMRTSQGRKQLISEYERKGISGESIYADRSF